MFVVCAKYGKLNIKCLVILSVKYVYAFVEKQSCAFYIFHMVSVYAFVEKQVV